MASSSPEHPIPSRADRAQQKITRPAPPTVDGERPSRSVRGRLVRERKVERRFAWAFGLVVTVTTVYLLSRTPWAMALLRHWHITP